MKRLLCIVANMNTGGAETFLMKMYRAIDREKYQMDFCVNSDTNFYEKEILELGGKIYTVPAKSQSLRGWYTETKRVVHDNGYRYVIRVCDHSLAALDLMVARQGGADHLIMRSSNASSGGGAKLLLHKMFQFLAITVPTVKLAPSTEAAEYTFGKGCVAKGNVTLLHNAIDTNIYHFDPEGRKRIREEFGLEGMFVVGHVGRFNQQKNHAFLLDVFCELHKKRPASRLVLVGQGELEEQIRQKAHSLGIAPYVVFTGVRKDVPQLMSAFDVFVFPSLYEGMPNTVIEAQATGLPCVISDTITKEADITGLVKYLPLTDIEHWAEWAQKVPEVRMNTKELFHAQHYDIASQAEVFVNCVFENLNGESSKW